MLGHSDTRMTERYTLGHVPAAMRAATTQFEAHLAAADEADVEGATTETHGASAINCCYPALISF